MSDKEPRKLDRALGQCIRLRRKMLGLSGRELGERIGLTSQQIQKYELGDNRVGFSRLVEIAGALECTVVELVNDVVGEQPPTTESFKAVDPDRQDAGELAAVCQML